MADASYDGLCLSFDLDWAPEFVLEDFHDLLRFAGLPATLFCTHRSEMVGKLLELPACEAALHPNLQDADDEPAALRQLHDDFRGASGVRVHRLYYHSGLLRLFHEAGLRYLSNDLEFLTGGLGPRYDWSEMVRLPIYWEDDVHATLLPDRFDLDALRLEAGGLKVLSFHPIHLYLNTSGMDRYLACKGDLRDPDKMRAQRRAGKGARTLFEALVNGARGRRFARLGEVADAFLAAAPHSERHARFMALREKGTE